MLKPLGISLLVLAAVVGGLGLVHAMAAVDVSLVRVEGDLSDAERRQVRDSVAAAVARSGLPAAADVVAAVEALGWTREIRVRRHWPDALHIWVQRETIAARWGTDAWLTTGGNVVRGDERARTKVDEPTSLPTFHTSTADGAETMRVFALLNDAARVLGLTVTRLDQDAAGWTATFSNGGRILLGRTDLHERFTRFAIVYRAALRNAPAPFERADARYEAGVAVRWRATTERHPRPAAPANLQLAAAGSPSLAPMAHRVSESE